MIQSKLTHRYHKFIGFTLIELVVVILIISILAVTVAPKFIGVGRFDASNYRDQMISALRLMQQRGMQDTRSGICHRILVNNKSYAQVADCSTNALITDWHLKNTGLQLASTSSASIGFSGTLTFDSLGRVEECGSSGCIIEIESDDNAQLCIESEGYIHAC